MSVGYDTASRQLIQKLSAIEVSKTELLRYKRQLKRFAAWCTQNKKVALPASPETIVNYINHLAEQGTASSIWETLSSALSGVHHASGVDSPISDYRVEKAWLDKLAPEEVRVSIKLQYKNFCDWCARKKLSGLPASPKTVLQYIRYLVRQITPVEAAYQALFALEQAHREAGFPSPIDDAGVQRLQEQYHERLLSFMAQKMLLALTKKGDIWAKRDALMISLAYNFGYKASELVALKVGDVMWEKCNNTLKDYHAIRVHYPQTDECTYSIVPQSSKLSPIPFMHAWLAVSRINDGALFRSIAKDGTVLEQCLSQWSVKTILHKAARLAMLRRGFSVYELYVLRRGERTVHLQTDGE